MLTLSGGLRRSARRCVASGVKMLGPLPGRRHTMWGVSDIPGGPAMTTEPLIRLRRKRRERLEAGAGAKREPVPDLSWREACAILHEELDRLPEIHRQPLMFCYLEGLTRDEAAAQLGRTAGSVKKSLERGRKLLRRR